MAYMGLRYRDLQHALPSIFSLLFIVTPVIYPPEILVKKGASYILYLNPFTSLIEVVRSPLLEGSLASTEHYIISILMSLIMLYCKYFIEKKWRRFVPFWS
jgi:ABC-type polysaccharide/polyol phosphate export permease